VEAVGVVKAGAGGIGEAEVIKSSDAVGGGKAKATKVAEAKAVGVVRTEAVDGWQWQKAVGLKQKGKQRDSERKPER